MKLAELLKQMPTPPGLHAFHPTQSPSQRKLAENFWHAALMVEDRHQGQSTNQSTKHQPPDIIRQQTCTH